MTTKIDLNRERHAVSSAGPDPMLVDLPDLALLMIDGRGDPNTAPDYPAAVQALYAVAYTAKFAIKRAPGGIDYVVMPLEGLWWTPDMAAFTVEDKSAWDWTMMIMAPEQVTREVFAEAAATAGKKHPSDAITRMRLERFAEGQAAQVMHIGPYATEGPTIGRLHAFIAERGYVRAGKHHEIYLSDPRRAAPERLKTIIRQPVAAGWCGDH